VLVEFNQTSNLFQIQCILIYVGFVTTDELIVIFFRQIDHMITNTKPRSAVEIRF